MAEVVRSWREPLHKGELVLRLEPRLTLEDQEPVLEDSVAQDGERLGVDVVQVDALDGRTEVDLGLLRVVHERRDAERVQLGRDEHVDEARRRVGCGAVRR